MRTGKYLLTFLLYVAGLMGSDGTVYPKSLNFTQSNQAFCEARALAIQDACNFDETPVILGKQDEAQDTYMFMNCHSQFRF